MTAAPASSGHDFQHRGISMTELYWHVSPDLPTFVLLWSFDAVRVALALWAMWSLGSNYRAATAELAGSEQGVSRSRAIGSTLRSSRIWGCGSTPAPPAL
jgi:hypothetical protein